MSSTVAPFPGPGDSLAVRRRCPAAPDTSWQCGSGAVRSQQDSCKGSRNGSYRGYCEGFTRDLWVPLMVLTEDAVRVFIRDL